MSPDIKFFGSEERVHVEGKVESEPTLDSTGKTHDFTGRVLYVENQEDANNLIPLVGQEIQMIDSRDLSLEGKKGGQNFFSPPVRLDKVEVKKTA